MKCLECNSESNIHLHHVVPKSKGGNITVPLCESCHSKVHKSDLSIKYLSTLGLFKKSKEELCRVFYLITVEQVGYKTISQDLSDITGSSYSVQKVSKLVNRLCKIKIDDMLCVFSDLLGLDQNKVLTSDFFKARWEFFLSQKNIDYRKRHFFNG